MKINIKKFKEIEHEKIIAFVDLSINDITIKGCKLVKNNPKPFLAMPTERGKDNKFYPIIWFDDLNDKNIAEESVINYYNKIKGV